MTDTGLIVVLGIARLLGRLGFVLFAGVLLCWAVGAAPRSTPISRPLVRLQRAGLIGLAAGALLSLLAVVGSLPGVGSATTPAPDLIGGGAIARLAVLAGTTLLYSDLTRNPPTRARRGWALVIILVLALTLLTAGPAIRDPDWILTTSTASWQLVGLAGTLGGLLIIRTAALTPESAPSDPTTSTDVTMIDFDRPALVARLSSVAVGLAALAALVAGLIGALGPGSGWVVVEVGLLIMVALALVGTRGPIRANGSRSSAVRSSPVRSSAVRVRTAALVVGGVVVVIGSLLPGQTL